MTSLDKFVECGTMSPVFGQRLIFGESLPPRPENVPLWMKNSPIGYMVLLPIPNAHAVLALLHKELGESTASVCILVSVSIYRRYFPPGPSTDAKPHFHATMA